MLEKRAFQTHKKKKKKKNPKSRHTNKRAVGKKVKKRNSKEGAARQLKSEAWGDTKS